MHAEILGQRHRGHGVDGGGGEDPVDLIQRNARIRQSMVHRLRHQLGRVAPRRLATASEADADAGGLAAEMSQIAHRRLPHAGSNKTAGAPFRSSILARTFMPTVTLSASIPTTRAIIRGPSARSISATL